MHESKRRPTQPTSPPEGQKRTRRHGQRHHGWQHTRPLACNARSTTWTPREAGQGLKKTLPLWPTTPQPAKHEATQGPRTKSANRAEDHLGVARLQQHAVLLPSKPDDRSTFSRAHPQGPRAHKCHGLLCGAAPSFED